MEKIVIRGARVHNLKNIDVEIPRDHLVVITGLSGSGKSTLAFDTLYAEGQRRYVESLSAYARQFLEQMERPNVESMEGLSPAIAIDQRSLIRSPRSTVGTVTEVYDYLRLLFARVGDAFCPHCGSPISSQTLQQMVEVLLRLPKGSSITLLSPIVRGKKGEYRKELETLRRDGFVKVKIDGQLRDLGEEIKLDKKKHHEIDVWVDRVGHGFYGFAAVEAAAMGIPVITQIGEYEKAFAPDCPFITVDRTDVAAAIVSLAEDENSRRALGARAREYAVDIHDSTKVARRCLELYESLMR